MDQKDTTKTILNSTKHFFSGTMLSRISGLLRDICMASAFGTEPSIAALFVAYRFSHMFRRLLGEGAMQSAFIPQFESLKKENPDKAKQFFKDLYISVALLLILLIALAAAALVSISKWIPLSPGNQEIITLAAILSPGLLFICLNGLNTSLLQCEKSYFIPSVAPVFFNLVWITGALLLSQKNATAAMPWLSLFIVFSCAAQWLFTTPQTFKFLPLDTTKSTPCLFSKELRKIAKPLILGIFGIAASQINNVLDVVFARLAHPEGPAYLWYAARIQQLPIGLFGVAVSGALLPPLARSFKNHDYTGFHKFLSFGMKNLILIMIPVSFAFFVCAESGISLVYGHGVFDKQSVVNTTWCLWGYTAGILPLGFVLVLAPAFYAQNNYKIPAFASFASVCVNVCLNALFVMLFKFGPASVAFATSISTYINFGILVYMLNRDLFTFKTNLNLLTKSFIASILGMFSVLFADFYFLNGSKAMKILFNVPITGTYSFSAQAVHLFVEASAFFMGIGISYLFFSSFQRADDPSIA